MTKNELKCVLLNPNLSAPATIKKVKKESEKYIKEHGQKSFERLFPNQEKMREVANKIGLILTQDSPSENKDQALSDSDFDCKIANKLICIQQRAKKIGKPFDLTFADVKRMYSRKRCQITGEPITLELGRDNSISFERVDASKGYTKDNTIIVCAWVNRLKNELLEAPEGRFSHDQKRKTKSLAKMFAYYAERV